MHTSTNRFLALASMAICLVSFSITGCSDRPTTTKDTPAPAADTKPETKPKDDPRKVDVQEPVKDKEPAKDTDKPKEVKDADKEKPKDDVKSVATAMKGGWRLGIDTSETDRNITGQVDFTVVEALKGGNFKLAGTVEYGAKFSADFTGTLKGELVEIEWLDADKKTVTATVAMGHTGFEPAPISQGTVKWPNGDELRFDIGTRRIKMERKDCVADPKLVKSLEKGTATFKIDLGPLKVNKNRPGKLTEIVFEKPNELGGIPCKGTYQYETALDITVKAKFTGRLSGNLLTMDWKEDGLAGGSGKSHVIFVRKGEGWVGMSYWHQSVLFDTYRRPWVWEIK